MTEALSQPLSVFICHASQDKPIAREICNRLKGEGWIDPWLDEDKLSPGQYWTTVVDEALDSADAVVIFLSKNSVQKESFVQRELNLALDLSLEKPDSVIFLIPVKLDDCETPRRLRQRHFVNYYGENKENAYLGLIRSLRRRYEQKLHLDAEKRASNEELVSKDARKSASYQEPIAKNVKEKDAHETVAKEEKTREYRNKQDQKRNEELTHTDELKKYFSNFMELFSTKQRKKIERPQENRMKDVPASKEPISSPNYKSQEITNEISKTEKKKIINHSIIRQAASLFIHAQICLFGWSVSHQWTGLLFISLPLLLTYYFLLYRLAIVLLPAANPEDKTEKWKRYIIFVSYSWGIQFPLMVVSGHAWKEPEIRIPGNFAQNLPLSGLIWTKSHQVVATTSADRSKRIDGPGVIYTNKFRQPEQIFDLRMQLRISEIDVISRDRINFKVLVFTAFRLDPEIWDKETFEKLRNMNVLLQNADKPDHTKGSFPYSSARIQATLGVTGTKAITATDNSTIYWDQWVINLIEGEVRKILSQRNLDELWLTASDTKESSALDNLASEIKQKVSLKLRAAGILVLRARVVNFRVPGPGYEIDEVSKQNLAVSVSEWQRKQTRVLSEAQIEADNIIQEANSYVESLMMNSVSESLQKVKELHPDISRNVIALRFLDSLRTQLNRKNQDEEPEELENYLKELQERLRKDQERGKQK